MTQESRFDSRLQMKAAALSRGDLTKVERRFLKILLRLNDSQVPRRHGARPIKAAKTGASIAISVRSWPLT